MLQVYQRLGDFEIIRPWARVALARPVIDDRGKAI
jgi:hypothetical protein